MTHLLKPLVWPCHVTRHTHTCMHAMYSSTKQSHLPTPHVLCNITMAGTNMLHVTRKCRAFTSSRSAGSPDKIAARSQAKHSSNSPGCFKPAQEGRKPFSKGGGRELACETMPLPMNFSNTTADFPLDHTFDRNPPLALLSAISLSGEF